MSGPQSRTSPSWAGSAWVFTVWVRSIPSWAGSAWVFIVWVISIPTTVTTRIILLMTLCIQFTSSYNTMRDVHGPQGKENRAQILSSHGPGRDPSAPEPETQNFRALPWLSPWPSPSLSPSLSAPAQPLPAELAPGPEGDLVRAHRYRN